MTTRADDSTTVAATLLDRLDMDEISLVPRGGNQRARIVATKGDDDAGASPSPAARFVGGLKRAFAALLAKGDPTVTSQDVEAGLTEAAAALSITLDVGKDDPAPSTTDSSPHSEPHTMSATPDSKTSTPADAAKGDAQAAGSAAAAAAAATATATPSMTPESVAKAVQDAVATATATLVAKLDAQAEVIAKLEAAQAETATRASFDDIFAGTTIGKSEKDALYGVFAKADEAGRAAIAAMATANKAALEQAALHTDIGKIARSHDATPGTAHGEAEAIAKSLQEKDGTSYPVAYAKALDLNPALAARVLAEERTAVRQGA